ncbi:unnamed protein product, partial [Rhizoctonia solani]
MATSPAGFKGPFIVIADFEIKEGHADTFEQEFRKVRECVREPDGWLQPARGLCGISQC